MKVRQSGMPDEELWNQLFDIDLILSELNIDAKINDAAEIGCGYGTFSIPIAKSIKGNLYCFDIEKDMVFSVQEKIKQNKIDNIITEQKDVLLQTTGLENNSLDYVFLFNILHNEYPFEFLNECHRILKPNGKIGIIHWRSDIKTHRGPSKNIRPKPEDIISWINREKFFIENGPFILKPYHYGVIVSKLPDIHLR